MGVYDFAVVGGGIAGASIARELAQCGSTVLLERERVAGYHTTGRSAAMFAPAYGPKPIRALTRASAAFFDAPPDGFSETPLLSPRDTLMIARSDQQESFESLYTELKSDGEVTVLSDVELIERYTLLNPEYAARGLLDVHSSDIDVASLHSGFLKDFKARRGEVRLGAEVKSLARVDGVWKISLPNAAVDAKIIVNAAGAWGEGLGEMAGAEPIGLVPKRRTALTIAAPPTPATRDYPLIVDVDEEFYLKPEPNGLLISPANEDPEPPCDVQPDEMDIALCIDRIERAFALKVPRIESKWSGLRSFVADKNPVLGFSDLAEGFFWCVGQGGYGIQTAPAMGRVGAALATGSAIPGDCLAAGVSANDLAPGRLALCG